jgi:hypothetical protein
MFTVGHESGDWITECRPDRYRCGDGLKPNPETKGNHERKVKISLHVALDSHQRDGWVDPKDLRNSTRAALVGAGLQGLIFGVVKAAVDRVGARDSRAVTHESPVP